MHKLTTTTTLAGTREDIKTRPEVVTPTQTEEEVAPRMPPICNLVLFNDAVTPGDWVVQVLGDTIGLSMQAAQAVTMKAHRDGEAVIGEYAKDMAEALHDEIGAAAGAAGHPLETAVFEKMSD